MYLKALEIQGFKSFPEKTRLSFEKDITVIVGPNGSGKSNISDALLWVMGEQKTRMLRGGKMEDVIFGGTEKRGAMGFAQVTLVLDNTSRMLQLDTDEVSISRRYYRSGESEYYINREEVRLRDVTELLMDTGLGADGYSIIGQGRISEIVSAKSTDRREIFEEAAGISRFRHRKDESERKLERTEENLLRVGDKIAELELQVGPLQEQSEKAKKYLVLRDELRVQEVSLWMASLDRLHEQSELLRSDYERSLTDCAAARSEQDRLYAESERLSERMRENDRQSEEKRQQLRSTESAAAEVDNAAAVLRTNLANNEETLLRLQREIGEQNDRAEGLLSQVREHRERIAVIETERRELAEQETALRKQEEENSSDMDEQSRRLSELAARESELNGLLAEDRTAISMLEEAQEQAAQRQSHAQEEMQQVKQRRSQAELAMTEARSELSAAREKEQSLSNVIAGHTMLMGSRERKASELAEQETRLTVDLRTCEGRIRMLSELEREMQGLANASKLVAREAERGSLRGVHAPIARLIRVEDRYALAVETALGGHMGDIVVDSQEDGKAVISFLKNRNGGRLTVQPIDVIEPARLRDEPRGEDGYVGICSDLIETDEPYRNIIANLVGRIAVAETLGDAIRIARRHRNSFRIVTLDGQLVNAGGSLTGGSAAKNTGILSRANELSRLQKERENLDERLRRISDRKKEAERELERARYDLDAAREELSEAKQECAHREGDVNQAQILFDAAEAALSALVEEQQTFEEHRLEREDRMTTLRTAAAKTESDLLRVRSDIEKESVGAESFTARRRELEESIASLKARDAALEAEKSTAGLAIRQLEQLHRELMNDGEQRRDTMAVVREKNREIRTEQEVCAQRLEALNQQMEAQKEQLTQLTAQKMEMEGRRSTTDKAAQEKNRQLLDLERQSALLEQKKLTADLEEKTIVDKLWDSYELSRTEAQTVRQEIESIPKATRRVSELKRSMSALGTPNLGAIEEYKRVSERYEFLTGQRDDVEKSRQEILNIIREITAQMEDIFRREVEKINAAFQQIFVELFGGGKASLSLEDENDVLNCGIDIRIQPPGKAVSNISLLSGGEKAFVAIALYFAIIRVRPTPFCVMDEIESALDEENVTRFAQYMRRMCTKTQFIAITHRRGTMDEADQLYGVTMQEKGISSVLAMDMDEALKTIR